MKREDKKRLRSYQETIRRITNKDIVCKDCVSRFDDEVVLGNTSRCAVYSSKPNEVLLGEECTFYEKGDSKYGNQR